MEFFRDTKIDFMKYRKYFMIVSVALLLISGLAVFVVGELNLGVDFAGGTQVTVKFKEQQEINDLRAMTAAAGIEDSQIQRFGDYRNSVGGYETKFLLDGVQHRQQRPNLAAVAIHRGFDDLPERNGCCVHVSRLALNSRTGNP